MLYHVIGGRTWVKGYGPNSEYAKREAITRSPLPTVRDDGYGESHSMLEVISYYSPRLNKWLAPYDGNHILWDETSRAKPCLYQEYKGRNV